MLHQVKHANTVIEVWEADPHGLRRPAKIRYGVEPHGTGAYTYDGAGNITAMGDDSYAYDLVSRIAHASLDSEALTRDYEYDNKGQGFLKKMGPYEFVGTDGPTVQSIEMDGESFAQFHNNLRGQIKTIVDRTVSWRPEQRLEWDMTGMLVRIQNDDASRSHRYLYTADDERVAIVNEVTGVTTWTLRGLDSKVLRTLRHHPTTGWTWMRDYLYREGVPIQWRGPLPGEAAQIATHLHTDHLGTPRLATTSLGGVASTYDYWPFGQEANTPNDPSLVLRYTGHERDFGEVGFFGDLDYMHTRVCSSTAGRFLSIDPINSGNPREPQSWLKYTYALNNPLKYVDPDGKDLFLVYDFATSGLSESQQNTITRGIR